MISLHNMQISIYLCVDRNVHRLIEITLSLNLYDMDQRTDQDIKGICGVSSYG